MEDEELLEEGSKSGEMSGDSLVINEDVEEDAEDSLGEEKQGEEPMDSESSKVVSQEEEVPPPPPSLPPPPPQLSELTHPVLPPAPVPARNITTLNVPSVTVSSHPPPHIPSLPPGTIAKPVLDPETPTEDGHDPTVRKLIIMAIDVMKNRKARPDGKRISNWINRRYGRPVLSINEELEKMVLAGELTRVDYKGSASYRITTAEAKSARRRRRLQKNNNSSSNGGSLQPPPGSNPQPVTPHPVVSREGGLIVEPILRQPNLNTAKIQTLPPPQVGNSIQLTPLPPHQVPPGLQQHPPQQQQPPTTLLPPQIQLTQKLPPHTAIFHPAYTNKFMAPQEITLRTLVVDYMNDLSSSGIPIEQEFDIKFVGRAVGASRRPINRTAVLANLESILEKEAQAGHFFKSGEGRFVLQAPLLSTYHPHHHPPLPPPPTSSQPSFILSPASMTNTIINPAPMPPPPSAGLPPFLSTSSAPPPPQMHTNLSEYMVNSSPNGLPPPHHQGLASATPPLPNYTKMTFIASGPPKAPSPMDMPPIQPPTPPHPPFTQYTNHSNTSNSNHGTLKSDEERKNDLIQEKLFKMNKSFEKHSPNRRPKAPPAPPTPPLYITLREKRLKAAQEQQQQQLSEANNNSNNGSRRSVGRPKKNAAPKNTPRSMVEPKRRKREIPDEAEDEGGQYEEGPYEDEEDAPQDNKKSSSNNNNNASGGNTRSSRKKKSRKIFDPADHDTPSRKRKLPSSQEEEEFIKEEGGGEPGDEEEEDEDVVVCTYCEGGVLKNKRGKPETLLKCKDCRNLVHPSCLDYTEDLCRKILEAPSWQCINCKVCSVCESSKEDQLLVFCDGCDLAFHRDCVSPKIISSKNSWECSSCRKSAPPSKSSSRSSNGHDLPMEPISEMKRVDHERSASLLLPPNLPPHLHPHTGNIPDNWEDYLPDPEIPDVSFWDPKQVEDYFYSAGFSLEQSSVFSQQEIDGKSLLLLQRSDVTSSLGLKLGPALKMFNHIKKLQTRRHFPG